MPKFLMSVNFTVETVVIEVEAASLGDAWANRFDLSAAAEPLSWEVHPSSVEEVAAQQTGEPR